MPVDHGRHGAAWVGLCAQVLVAVLALAGGNLWGQEYSFRYFGMTEGLSNLAVRKIFQDRVGFIWVSTENGIYRYDGERFEGFGPAQGLPSNSGAAFGDAPDGSLLAGGDFGLYRLSGNRFEKIPGTFKTINWAEGIASDGRGHTFLGTDAGLVELSAEPRSDHFAQRKLPQAEGTSGPGAFGILIDGDTVWYGCGEQLCRMDAHGTRVFGRESGLPDRPLLMIQKDGAGNLWVRARNAGVFEWPAGEARFARPVLPAATGGPGGVASGVASIDSEGRILLTSAEGLLIGDGKKWQKVDRTNGLRGTVYSAFEDRQHTLWIGLAGRGLAQWRGYREWESYSTASGLTSDVVYEMLPRSDGSLWVATEAGLFRGERRQYGYEFKKVAGLTGFAVHSLRMGPDGNQWIGTETRGAARIDSRSGAVQWFGDKQGLTGKAAYTLRFDRERRLWAATDAGLFVSKAPYARFSRILEVPAARVWAVAESGDGTIWAGGIDGLFEYADGRWRNLKHSDGLSNQEVLSLGAGANGTMWVGYRYGGGIDRVHAKADGVTIEKGVQRPGSDGLVYFLDFDDKGRLWAGTERGVDMWDGSRWSHYDMTDGLVWDDCNLNAFAEEPDGTIWIGTGGGLSRYKPHRGVLPDVPLTVVFTRLAMGGTDVSSLSNPSFGSRADSLTARYSALNSPRENEVVFRYRLEGAGSGWTETRQRELQFAKLAPGEYQLEVEAQNGDGIWSQHRAEFPFTILTPWYRTWWFIGLCLLIPLLALMAAMRWRILGARRRERELVRLVEEKTVDLQRANEELSRLSFTDPLTGLANRRLFDQALEKECARRTRTRADLSLVMVDVDHFKALNDAEGHQRGDEYLVLLGAELARIAKRRIDLAARVGGEEFALILPITNNADAVQVGESLRAGVEGLRLSHPNSPVAPFLTVSVGVATATAEALSSPESLVAAADQALYRAKRGGRNQVVAAEWGSVEQDLEGSSMANPS